MLGKVFKLSAILTVSMCTKLQYKKHPVFAVSAVSSVSISSVAALCHFTASM